MAWYTYPANYSNNTGIDGIADFFIHANTLTNGSLAMGITIIIWLSVFLMSLGSGSRKALVSSSFVSLIFAVYFARLSMMNPLIVIVFIVLLIVGIIFSRGENQL